MSDPLPRLPEGYRPVRRLGAGGMGEVWLAERSGVERAIKLLRLAAGGEGEQDRLRFKREFLALSRLAHPGIVGASDFFELDGQLGYAMEFVAGWPLRQYLQEGRWRSGAPAPEFWREPAGLETLWRLADELLDALAHLHAAGFVHRDLKPANVMVGGDGRLRLIDFGLARPQRELLAITAAGEVLGTPSYLAPEQIRGLAPDPRTDLYAFGVMLYELATGALPFPATTAAEVLLAHLQQAPEPPQRRNPALGPGRGAFILRCLAKEPAARFAGAREAAAALRQAARESGASQISETGLIAAPENLAGGGLLVPPHTGNRGARAEIRRAAEALAAGRGGFLVATGPAGAGKSRLFDELRAACLERGARVVRATARAGGGLPAQLFFDLFARLADDLARQPERAAAWLGEDGPALAARFAPLRRFAAPAPGAEAASPAETRAELMTALYGFFARAAAEQPVALLAEDLHWADELSRDLLSHLAAGFAGEGVASPLLVAANARPDDPDAAAGFADWLASSPSRRVPLAPLSAAELGELLQGALGLAAPPEPDLAAELHAFTGGNPFYLLELLRAAAERGELAVGDGEGLVRWAATGRTGRLPDSLDAVVGRRLDALSRETREALAAAALLGREFRFAWWRGVSGLTEDALLDRADEALRAGVLAEEPDDRLRFSHDLIRARLLGELSGLRRRRLHGRAAETLAAAGDPLLDAAIAEHAVEAGRDDLALRHGAPAVESLDTAGATAEASDLLDRLLPAAERAEEALLPFAARVRVTFVSLLTRRAERHRVREEAARLRPLFDRLADPAVRDAARFRLLRIEANALYSLGDYAAAAALVPAQLSVAGGDPGREAQAHELDAITASMTGDGERAAAAFARSLAAAARVPPGRDRDRIEAYVVASLAQFEIDAGRVAAAAVHTRDAMALSERAGVRLEHAVNVANHGGVLLELGRLDEADRLLREGLRLTRRVGYRPVIPEILHNLSRISLLRGEPEEALRLASEGAEDAASRAERHYEALARCSQMSALDALGRGPEARAVELKALALADSVGTPQLRASLLLEAGTGLLSAGDAAGAADRASTALALAAGKFPDSEALALALRAAAGAGEPGDSGRAVALAAGTGSVLLRLRVALHAAAAELALGRRGDGRARLEALLPEARATGMTRLSRAAERALARIATDALDGAAPA